MEEQLQRQLSRVPIGTTSPIRAPSMSPTADGSGPWIGSKHTLGSPAGHFMYIIVPDFG